MTFHRHPSFFPLVLIALTLALGFFMFSYVRTNETSINAPAIVTVDPDAYRTAVRTALAPVLVPDGKDRAGDVVRAIDALLRLRVPTRDMQAHLEFVGSLSQIRDGLKGDTNALKEGQARFDAAVAASPWVR